MSLETYTPEGRAKMLEVHRRIVRLLLKYRGHTDPGLLAVAMAPSMRALVRALKKPEEQAQLRQVLKDFLDGKVNGPASPIWMPTD